MKTPKEFDYYLWTTNENNEKHFWVRVKHTGEVLEVDINTMRYLRSIEKAMKRKLEKAVDRTEEKDALSYHAVSDNGCSEEWMIDRTVDVEAEAISSFIEKAFITSLTDKQRDVYLKCMKGGQSFRAYAKENGIAYGSVADTVAAIRNKFRELYR